MYFFFSRRFTLIFFTLIYAYFSLRPSAFPICAYLRELFFLNFSLADLRRFFFSAPICVFQSANICVNPSISFLADNVNFPRPSVFYLRISAFNICAYLREMYFFFFFYKYYCCYAAPSVNRLLKYSLLNFMGISFTFSHRFQVRSTVLFVAEIVSTNFKGTAYRNNYGINLKDDFYPSTKF